MNSSTQTPQLPPISWMQELNATMKLAWPLIIAQVAGILLFTTDVVMMGWLGPSSLAAGTLATSLLHPAVLTGIGVVSATSPLIAQAIGARESKSVRRTVRQGIWVAIVMSAIIVPFLLLSERIFLALGQDANNAYLAQTYLNFALIGILASLATRSMHSLLQAKGSTAVILIVTIAGILVNALGNYALMFGNFGFPRLELVGAGISTSFVSWVMFALTLAYVLMHKKYRRYHVMVRFFKPDWPRFFDIFKVGLPIGLTLMSEVGLFGVAVIMMGWLGTNEIAAHAVAIQFTAIAFMIPLGLSTATTVRVGLAYGAKNADGIAKAAWTSTGVMLVVMTGTCALFLLAPELLVRLFLDPAKPENQIPIILAISYLGVAALFQFVDGAQVIMLAALRGMSDTRVAMFVAMFGYWIVGTGTAYFLGFVIGWGGVGIWSGLAAGLGFVSIALTIRFAWRQRLGLINF